MRRFPLVLLLAVAIAIAAPATARPQPSAQPGPAARAKQVLAEVDELDRRIERVAEAYDLAGVRLDRTRSALRTNARALPVARHNLARAQTMLARRLVSIYERGDADSTISVVVGARNLSDLIESLNAGQLITRQDAQVIGQVRKFRTAVISERRRLHRQLSAEEVFRRTLAQKRVEIERSLAQRRLLLSSIRAEVARLQAQERARQQQLRRQAQVRLAARQIAEVPPAPVVGAVAATPDGPSVVPPSRHGHVVPIAMQYLGVPYQWGGASPSTGFDCSGFVLYVYAQVGVSLPHNAAMQYGYGTPVDRDDLQPGDLVFFDNLGHDGIYIGGGQFIQAPKTGDVVKISSLSEAGTRPATSAPAASPRPNPHEQPRSFIPSSHGLPTLDRMNENKRVVVVDDERSVQEVVRAYLERDGYHVFVAGSGGEGLALAERVKPGLVVLDLMLPDRSGEEICKEIRSRSDVPILMLTAKASEEERVEGLALGADDYLVKPFSPRELVLRVRAILRRTQGLETPLVESLSLDGGALEVDTVQQEVRREGELVELTPSEYKLLVTLARYPGRVYSRFELINHVQGYEYEGYERTIDAHVKNLRKKIEPDPKRPRYIETVFGTGYRLKKR